jgi:hypothetical protein
MTEAGWLASSDTYEMLLRCWRVVRQRPRKGQLFAVACCYRIWHLFTDSRSRAAVEAAALHTEGRAGEDELRAAHLVATAAHREAFAIKGKVGACPEWAAQYAADPDPWHAAQYASNFA